jgi:glutathione synthase/RimK-type ligase-like ATP-grasp enzyme
MHATPEGVFPLSSKCVAELALKGKIVKIPKTPECLLFDNKIAQTRAYGKWMPRTWHITKKEAAYEKLKDVELPFISKSSNGYRSNNVRFVRDLNTARTEIESAFSGDGIPIFEGHRQKGYLLWQEFIPGSRNDWRIGLLAKRFCYALRRMNRESVPFASGSGVADMVEELDDEAMAALDFAMRFVRENDLNMTAIDVIKGKDGKLFLLESSCAWDRKKEYFGDPIFENVNGEWKRTKFRSRHFFEILGKGIVEGLFDN